MLAKLLASVLLVQAVLSQEPAEEQTRRLRFRRPRPKLIDVDDPEGELEGSPVPVLIPEASAQVFNSAQSSGNAALEALIATAQKDDAPEPSLPSLPAQPIQNIPVQAAEPQEPITPLRQPTGQRAGGRRRVPGVPRRRRPRPQERPAAVDGEESAPATAPRGRPRGEEAPVATLERYSHKNDDGSFTFGYVGADGSFREETRGVDCITRGKYGYIDPDGVKREYTYTSGLPCEIGEDGEQLQDIEGEINVDDPVDPRERFRQTQQVQLAENEIPEPARRQRIRTQVPQRRPEPEAPAAAPVNVQNNNNAFTNFAANSNRAQIPQRRPAPTRNGGAALENLLNIADGSQPAAPATPQPAAAVPAIPQRTRPVVRPQAGSFDFDSELEGFTLNRPSLTFEENRNDAANKPSTSFQSQLVFDEQTGTFQTQLQQNIPGSGTLNLQNAAAPFTAASTTTQAPIADNDFTLTTRVTAAPTPRPVPALPTAAAPAVPSSGVVPAGTIKLDFEPLNIPTGPIATPAPARPAPRPAPTTVNLPTPTQPASRAPVPLTAAPAQPIRPAAQAPAPGQNTFFVFQPFNQGGQPLPSPRPASQPFQTPLNPNAFTINPAAQGARPAAQTLPAGVQPSAAIPQFNLIGQPAAASSAPAPAPIRIQPAPQAAIPRPAPQASVPRPAPQASAPRPAAPPAFQPATPQSTPQLQFGFQPVQQPVQQQPPRRVPFTAFRNGTPPQLQASFQNPNVVRPGVPAASQPQQLGSAPVRFQGAAPLGVPPQLQGAPSEQPRFAPQPNAARPATFVPQPSGAQPFSVFNPVQLRGA